MDGTILRPSRSDDGVDVLFSVVKIKDGDERVGKTRELTFAFGGAGFGLQAFLTTFSNEDICERPTFLYLAICTLTPEDGRLWHWQLSLALGPWSGHLPPRNHFPFMVLLPQKRLAAGLGSGEGTLPAEVVQFSWHFYDHSMLFFCMVQFLGSNRTYSKVVQVVLLIRAKFTVSYKDVIRMYHSSSG